MFPCILSISDCVPFFSDEIMNGIMKPDEPVASTSGNAQNANSIQGEGLPLSDDSNSVTLVDTPDTAGAAAVSANAIDGKFQSPCY